MHPDAALEAPSARCTWLARLGSWAALVALVSASLGCRARLPAPAPTSGEAERDAGALEVLPARPLDELATVTRFRWVTSEPVDAPLPTVVLVEGSLTDAERRKLDEGSLTKALEARAIALTVVRELVEPAPTGGEPRSAVLVQPRAPLAVGAHTLFAAGLERPLVVAPRASDRVLARVFPEEAGLPLSVFCADEPLTFLERDLSLGQGARGVVRSLGDACVELSVEASGATLVLPPVSLEHDADTLLFDPRPLSPLGEPPAAPGAPGACAGATLGPLCVRVQDDRLGLATLDGAPRFVSFEVSGDDQASGALVIDAGETLRGLAPSSSYVLSLAVLGADGARDEGALSLVTEPPRARPALSEVLANPVGKEPREEWIELYDDGLAAVELEGWVLREPGGDVVLPAHVLEPGAFVLVVRDDFVGDGLFDVAPALGVPLLRVPTLGGNGLSNAGEPLVLVDPSGLVVSRVPAIATPHAGRSLCRRWPFGLDDDSEGAFVEAAPTPGLPECAP